MSPAPLKITVVTVALDSASTIADTLRSVARQTHPAVEHIVIDGGSRDGTPGIVRREGAHVAQLVCEPDRGLYDAMNKGLALATGDVVGFLNSDDVFADDHALAHIAHAMRPSTVDAVYGDLVFVRHDDLGRIVRYWRCRPYHRGAVGRGWAPPHPTFYVRREAYLRHGGYDDSFRISADFEMALRLLDVHGLHAVQIPHVLVRMRLGGASTRSFAAVAAGNREAMRACQKHGLPGGLRFVTVKLASRLPQLLQRPH